MELEKLSTRRLLKMLHNSYYCSYGCSQWDCEEAPDCNRGEVICNLKKVLATREHVPNKLEIKEMRRERAKLAGEARDKRCVKR